ncbi:MAG: MmgE/PrpD family protein [Burkholderiales bacterium]
MAFVERASYDVLPADVVHECKRRVIDTFASALGAFDNPTSAMAHAVAARSRTDHPASVWGSSIKTTPEAAAFANGVMTRLLDISDTCLGKSRGHPSDMNSGIIAVAESEHADGKSLINAITLAYDVYCSFCNTIDVNARGWDQPVYGVLGCVTGVGTLLKLSRDAMANAISLALAPNMALAQARRGHLSNWKGCAGANASRNAVFAAMLAKDGFTGPTAVFEGDGGLWQVIGRHEWPLPEKSHLISETHMKCLPICYHGQAAVFAALELRDQCALEDIVEICVDTYGAAVMMMGTEPSRWAPTTRETADHSMPYVVATALMDGAVTDASFSDARLVDRKLGSLMAKIKVQRDDRLESLYPEGSPSRVTVRTKNGATREKEVIYPLGHFKHPLSDAQVVAKFHEMTAARLTQTRRDDVLDVLWHLDQVTDVADVIAKLCP